MIGVGRHRLIKVSPRQCGYYREHLTAGQSHVSPTVKRRLCKSRRPETRDLHLNHPEIVMRGRLLHTPILPYKGNRFNRAPRSAKRFHPSTR